MEEKLEIFRVYFQGFVVAGADQLAVADAAGPGRGAVSETRKRFLPASGEGFPRPRERVGEVGFEVATALALGFDDRQVLGAVFELVGMRRLEDIRLERECWSRPSAAGEVLALGLSAPELAIERGPEEMRVGRVADYPEVEPLGLGGRVGHQRLWLAPGLGIAQICRGGVAGLKRRGSGVVGELKDEKPALLRLIKKELGCAVVLVVEGQDVARCSCGIGPGLEANHDNIYSPRGKPDGGVDVPEAFVKDDCRVLDRHLRIGTLRFSREEGSGDRPRKSPR